jgi:hypothetical protein
MATGARRAHPCHPSIGSPSSGRWLPGGVRVDGRFTGHESPFGPAWSGIVSSVSVLSTNQIIVNTPVGVSERIRCLWCNFAQTPVGGSVRWCWDRMWWGCWNVDGHGISRLQRVASTREMTIAKVIEFYVPAIFRKPLKGAPEQPCGKVIEFCIQTRKSA